MIAQIGMILDGARSESALKKIITLRVFKPPPAVSMARQKPKTETLLHPGFWVKVLVLVHRSGITSMH